MNPIEFSVQVNKNDIQRGFALAGAESRPKWVGWVWFAPLGAFALLAAGTLNPTLTTIFFTYLALVLVVDVINRLLRQSALNKIWSENEAWHSPFHVSLSEVGITTESVYGKSIGNWHSHKRVLENEDYFIFLKKNATFLVVPKRELKDGVSQEIGDFLKKAFPGKLRQLEK